MSELLVTEYGAQHPALVQLPEQDFLCTDELRDGSGQPSIEVGEAVPDTGMNRHRKQRLDSEVVRALEALGPAGALFAQQPLRLAPVEVGPQVDQRVDHLLAALMQARYLDRRRQMIREQGKG